jgi:hypothetical protein
VIPLYKLYLPHLEYHMVLVRSKVQSWCWCLWLPFSKTVCRDSKSQTDTHLLCHDQFLHDTNWSSVTTLVVVVVVIFPVRQDCVLHPFAYTFFCFNPPPPPQFQFTALFNLCPLFYVFMLISVLFPFLFFFCGVVFDIQLFHYRPLFQEHT